MCGVSPGRRGSEWEERDAYTEARSKEKIRGANLRVHDKELEDSRVRKKGMNI